MTDPIPKCFSRRAKRTEEPPISWLMSEALAHPEYVSLAAGFVDQETLPSDEVLELARMMLAHPERGRAALQYGTTAGAVPLREKILGLLARDGVGDGKSGCRLSVEDIVVANGSQQILYLAANALVDPGDIVLVEDPTYFVYLGVLNEVGAVPLGVATDEKGMIPEALQERLKSLNAEGKTDRVKLVYLMLHYANPTGVSLDPERRGRILEVLEEFEARSHRLYLLEDIAYRELRIDGPEFRPIKEIEPENLRVITTGTFSKGFSPGFRLGYGVLPPEIRAPVMRMKGNQDFGSTNLNQCLLTEAIEHGAYQRHTELLRETYRRKRDLFVEALREYMPDNAHFQLPRGGFYVWMHLESVETGPNSRLFKEALRQEVLYVPGEYCYCPEEGVEKDKHSMRLCYGLPNNDVLREGARRLGKAIGAVSTP